MHCFLAENIIREYIRENKLSITNELRESSTKFMRQESRSKSNASLSINIRKLGDELDYLDLKNLAKICEMSNSPLADTEKKYKPIRDAVMHTAILTEDAYKMLEAMYRNIRGRIQELLQSENGSS